MMLVCINCSNDTKMKMDYLLAKDCYRDYSELVAIAVENLWMLDRDVDEKGGLVIGDSTTPLVTSLASPPLGRARSVSSVKTAPPPPRQSRTAGAPPTPATSSQVQIPEM